MSLACTIPCLAEGADTKAVPLRTPPPDYPMALRKANITGLVVVRLEISAEGKVTEAAVVKSSQPKLEPHALKAVKTWIFKPATKDGVAVPATLSVPLQFQIES